MNNKNNNKTEASVKCLKNLVVANVNISNVSSNLFSQ